MNTDHVLYPFGSRVLTRDAGMGTVVAVQDSSRVWQEDRWVDVPQETFWASGPRTEAFYKVRLDATTAEGRVIEGWRSASMLLPPDDTAGDQP